MKEGKGGKNGLGLHVARYMFVGGGGDLRPGGGGVGGSHNTPCGGDR